MPKSKKKARDLTADEVMSAIFTPKVAKKIKKLIAPKAKKSKKK